MSESWAVKHRPKLLKHFIGNEDVTRDLNIKIKKDTLPNTLSITGPTSSGKTSLARIIAGKYTEKDDTAAIQEVDGASERGIDNIRAIISTLQYKPLRSKKKVIIVDEIHKITLDASTALLKTLEEPPAHVMFIFATNEKHRLLETIKNRAYKIDLKPMSAEDLFTLLHKVAEKESVFQPQAKFEKTLKQIAKMFDGRPRDALTYLHKLSDKVDPTVEDQTELLKSLVGIEFSDIPRFLNLVYNGEKAKAFAILERVTDFSGFSAILLELNTKLLQHSTGLTPQWSWGYNKVFLKGLPPVNPVLVNKYQKRLIDFRRDLVQSYSVDPQAIAFHHCVELTGIED